MFLLYTCTLCEFTRSEEKKQALRFFLSTGMVYRSYKGSSSSGRLNMTSGKLKVSRRSNRTSGKFKVSRMSNRRSGKFMVSRRSNRTSGKFKVSRRSNRRSWLYQVIHLWWLKFHTNVCYWDIKISEF